MAFTLMSGSDQNSSEIGAFMASVLEPGDVLCLEGPLGTGKTVLVRGLARGRGYGGPVPSPTFTIINPYPEIGLCHVDAFRLSGPEELIEAGIEEYLDGDWVCAVEWAQRVRGALPSRALEVSLAFGDRDDDRLISVAPAGQWDGRWLMIETELGRYA
jgi:tRNA threonylcarbamoyladenosine biosynthesis protein TsaE